MRVLALTMTTVILALSAAGAGSAGCIEDFFPTAGGHYKQWQAAVQTTDPAGKTMAENFVSTETNLGYEEIDGSRYFVKEVREQGAAVANLLYYRLEPDRVLNCGRQLLFGPVRKSTSTSELRWHDPPRLVLQCPLKVGARWRSPLAHGQARYRVAAANQVAVTAAGTFSDCFLVEMDSKSTRTTGEEVVTTTTMWYSPGIGAVKKTSVTTIGAYRYRLEMGLAAYGTAPAAGAPEK